MALALNNEAIDDPLTMAQAFLEALGPGPYTFQTFTDNKAQKIRTSKANDSRDPLARVCTGYLHEFAAEFAKLNAQGAGVYVQISEGGRSKAKVTAVRALFVDVDDVARATEIKAEISNFTPNPTIIVNSSPGKWHYYWRVTDCPLDAFKPIQQGLAIRFATDVNVCNLDRVMRLPGFNHCKDVPTLVTCVCADVEYATDLVVTCAKEGKNLTPTRIADGDPKESQDVFGLDLSDAYELPTVLPPGDRTYKLIQYVGALVQSGYDYNGVVAAVNKANVERCPAGAEPIPNELLEVEVFPAIQKWIDDRDQEITEDVEAPTGKGAPQPPPAKILHPPPKVAHPPRKAAPPHPPAKLPQHLENVHVSSPAVAACASSRSTPLPPTRRSTASIPPNTPALPPKTKAPPPPPPPKAKVKSEPAAAPKAKAKPAPPPPLKHSLNMWLERFVFIESGSHVADKQRRGEHAVRTLNDFKNTYAGVYAAKQSLMSTQWLKSKERVTVVATTYVPDDSQIVVDNGFKVWNTYRPSDVKPAAKYDAARIKPFLDHIDGIFHLSEDRNVFLSWLAMTVTRPHIRVPWMPILVSDSGAGKGWMFQVITQLVGEQNSKLINSDRLAKDFNSYLHESTLVLIDEMEKLIGTGAHSTLKTAIVEPRLEINVKQVAEKQTKVYSNFLGFSNNTVPIHIESDKDRRYWVYRWHGVPTPEYFEGLYAWSANMDNLRHLRYWIDQYDLSDFKFGAPPPMTEAKRAIVEASKTELEQDMLDAFENREGPFGADVVSLTMVHQYLESKLNHHIQGPNEGVMQRVWADISEPLPADKNRVRLAAGDGRNKTTRVKCCRRLDFWSTQSREAIAHEALRSQQMVFSPDHVDKPKIEAVPTNNT